MIAFNTYDLNKKQNVAFGTRMGFSAKRAIRKLYKGQKIPQSVKAQIQDLKKDGIKAKIVASAKNFYADKKAFGINKDGRFNVKMFRFAVKFPKGKNKMLLFATSDSTDFTNLFTEVKIKQIQLPSGEKFYQFEDELNFG